MAPYFGPAGAVAGAGKNASGSDTLGAPTTTTSATLEDVTGLSTTVTLGSTGDILAVMHCTLSSTGGGANAYAAIAININSVDGTESQRFLSGTTDQGMGAAVMLTTGLVAGTYTVKARFRRVSGDKTVQMDLGEIVAIATVA